MEHDDRTALIQQRHAHLERVTTRLGATLKALALATAWATIIGTAAGLLYIARHFILKLW